MINLKSGESFFSADAFDKIMVDMNIQIGQLLNKSLELLQKADLDGAEVCLKQVIQIEANNPHALRFLGIIAAQKKQYQKAISYFHSSLESLPENPLTYSNLGNVYLELKQYEEALKAYDQSLKMEPRYEEAWSNKGNVLYALERFDEALAHHEQALRLQPNYVAAWSNKGNVLYALKRFDEALVSHEQALTLQPTYAEAWFNRGNVLKELARISEAKDSFTRALELKPEYVDARWAIPFLTIPNILNSAEESLECRRKFEKELDTLEELFLDGQLDGVHGAVGSHLPFYLAYQELNNKDLLSKYGSLCNHIMSQWQLKHDLKHRASPSAEKIQLGIVSDHFKHHSVWHAIIKGWLANLDLSKFEIHLFYLGSSEDLNTDFAKAKASSFTSNQPSLLAWSNAILEKNIEALIYPEIGMNQLATQLANLRLAPIQMVAWGHPETSGLPTMDYYLSAELFETDGSDGAYSEKLIRLPNLGCSYSRLLVGASDFDLVSIAPKSDSAIFVCPGMLFKYAPQNDWIFASIAKKVGKCQFIFFYEHNHSAEILKARLKKVFEEESLEVDHYVLFIPLLARENFYGLLKRCDVFLDTIGFSGFNTAIQAIDCGLPIVTKEGAFMRGRLASGILKRMALDECIATTDQEYIELAVRLAQDKPYRDQVSSKMSKNRDILYDDPKPIRALEEFLMGKCRV